MMESTPEQDKATVLEAFDTLFNRDSAGGVLESGVSARARRGTYDKRSRGASSETIGLAHSVGGSDGLFGRRPYRRSNPWAGSRGGATEGRSRMSAGADDGGFEPSAPSRVT